MKECGGMACSIACKKLHWNRSLGGFVQRTHYKKRTFSIYKVTLEQKSRRVCSAYTLQETHFFLSIRWLIMPHCMLSSIWWLCELTAFEHLDAEASSFTLVCTGTWVQTWLLHNYVMMFYYGIIAMGARTPCILLFVTFQVHVYEILHVDFPLFINLWKSWNFRATPYGV